MGCNQLPEADEKPLKWEGYIRKQSAETTTTVLHWAAELRVICSAYDLHALYSNIQQRHFWRQALKWGKGHSHTNPQGAFFACVFLTLVKEKEN